MKLVASFSIRDCNDTSGFEKIVDVRRFKNPYHNKQLRQLNGLDPRVQEEVISSPGCEDFIQKLIEEDPESLAVGCHAGRHRSVAIAEEIGRRAGCKIWHINQPNWPKTGV